MIPLECHYNHPVFFSKPNALFLLLLKLLISFETLLGNLISEVNFFQPSTFAVLIAFLYSLLREL